MSLAETFVPRDWQSQIMGNPPEGIKEDDAKYKVIAAHRKSGKYLSIDTEIPLADGTWKTIGQMRVGDIIFDERGKPTKVTDVFPIRIDKSCFRLTFNDGTKIICSDDHRWLTQTKLDRASGHRGYRRNGTVKTTDEISKTILYQGETNHSIPLAKPLTFRVKKLLIPPYILGLWLGDGTTKNPEITTMDTEIVEVLKQYAQQIGCTVKKKRNYRISRSHTYAITGNGAMRAGLRSLGVLGNKHIPREYLSASISQRLELLRGIMDTDGCVTKSGRECEVVSKLESLADNYVELIIGLGHQVLRKKKLVLGRIYHRVFFRPRMKVFKLAHKAEKLRLINVGRNSSRFIVGAEKIPSVPVRCISVSASSHLYLCSRSCIPTHNTVMALMYLFGKAISFQSDGFMGSANLLKARSGGMRVARFTYIAPTYGQAKDIAWDLLKDIVPRQCLMRKPNETNLEIRLNNRVLINLKGSDREDTLRGPGLQFALLDEYQNHKPHIWDMIIRPELGFTDGGAMFIGTPNGRNHFYDAFKLGRDGAPHWKSWLLPATLPTLNFNKDTKRGRDLLAPGFLEEIKSQVTEKFYNQEYECEFQENAGMVFDRVDENVVDEWRDYPEAGHRYAIGFDPALREDFSAFVVLDLTDRRVKYVYRTSKIDLELLLERAVNIYHSWTTDAGSPDFKMDTTGMGDPIYENLVTRGVGVTPIKFTSQSKSEMVKTLGLLLNKDEIKIPRLPWFIDELKDYTYERLASGRYRYGAMPGKNDDGVCALMLATYQLPPMMGVYRHNSNRVQEHFNRFTGYSMLLAFFLPAILWILK